jgi:hypothetical protein
MEADFENQPPASRLIICTMSFSFPSILCRHYLFVIEHLLTLK